MFITLTLILALIVFLFSFDFSWSNVVSGDRNNLVFEGRNQEYGAYRMRREHHKTLFLAMILSIGLIGGGLIVAKAAMRVTSSVVIPDSPDIDPINWEDTKMTIQPKEPKKPEPRHSEEPRHVAAGSQNNEVDVVDDNDTDDLQSADDRHDKPVGDGGDDTGEIIEPVDFGCVDCDGEEKKIISTPVRTFVKNLPQFPGGESALIAFMISRVKLVEREIEMNVQGTIYLSFVVDTDGSIHSISLQRGIFNGDRLATQAIRAIEEMPKWQPGDDGGAPLPVQMTLPLKISIQE